MRINRLMQILEELKNKHGNLRVGFTGHYGEFYELEEVDVWQSEVEMEELFTRINKEKVVELSVPYIGQEPD